MRESCNKSGEPHIKNSNTFDVWLAAFQLFNFEHHGVQVEASTGYGHLSTEVYYVLSTSSIHCFSSFSQLKKTALLPLSGCNTVSYLWYIRRSALLPLLRLLGNSGKR